MRHLIPMISIILIMPAISFSQRVDTVLALKKLQRYFHNIPINTGYQGWVNYVENDDSYKYDSTNMGSIFLKLTDKLYNPFQILDLQYEYVIERIIMKDTLNGKTLDTADALYMVAIFPNNAKALPQIKKIVKEFKKEFRPLFSTKHPHTWEDRGHVISAFSMYLKPTDDNSFISIYYSYSESFKKYYLAIELTRKNDYKLAKNYSKMYMEK